MKEVWKRIEFVPTKLEVSNKGGIRRVSPDGKISDAKAFVGKAGYSYLGLKLVVHRLVAMAFIGPWEDGMYVNHIDGNKANNRASNLEYVTPLQNSQHAKEKGLYTYRGENHDNSRLTNKDVRKICKLFGKMSMSSIAKIYKIHPSAINNIKNGRSWAHVTKIKKVPTNPDAGLPKPIHLIGIRGGILATYKNSVEAAKANNLHRSHVSLVCNGKTKSAKGLRFRFAKST